MNIQPELDLDAPAGSGTAGWEHWRAERDRQMFELSKQMGLPLGRQVEIELVNGPVLRGRLLLDSPELFLPSRGYTQVRLRIGRAVFEAAHVSQCVVV
ncbi:MAG: hypothetical protein ACR2OZ_13880 [Verrucomicrobiales bacterium]